MQASNITLSKKYKIKEIIAMTGIDDICEILSKTNHYHNISEDMVILSMNGDEHEEEEDEELLQQIQNMDNVKETQNSNNMMSESDADTV